MGDECSWCISCYPKVLCHINQAFKTRVEVPPGLYIYIYDICMYIHDICVYLHIYIYIYIYILYTCLFHVISCCFMLGNVLSCCFHGFVCVFCVVSYLSCLTATHSMWIHVLLCCFWIHVLLSVIECYWVLSVPCGKAIISRWFSEWE